MADDVPITSGFMAVSLVGFFVSIFFVMDFDVTWGTTFTVFFFIMFVAAMVSMTKALPIPAHIENLDIKKKIHERPVKKLYPGKGTKRAVKKAVRKIRRK